MKIKAKILIITICNLFLAGAAVLAQQNEPGAGAGTGPAGNGQIGDMGVGGGYQFGDTTVSPEEWAKKIEELMGAPTGKMTDDIYMEVTARIAACNTDITVSEDDFNKLKEPYDITSEEYAAYAYQNFARITEDANNGWEKKYNDRVEELKQNGCVFDTNPDSKSKLPCMDADGDNPDRSGAAYFYGKITGADGKVQNCNPCKYEDKCSGKDKLIESVCGNDKEKCKYGYTTDDYPAYKTYSNKCRNGCIAEVEHDCQYGCYAGRCLTEKEAEKTQCEGQCMAQCTAGTVDAGQNGCPLRQKGCSYVNDRWVCEYYPQEKCCKKAATAVPENGTCPGICAKSATCPDGYENAGTASCVQDENCYKCNMFSGWAGGLKWFTCCDYTPKTCCVAKADAPPVVAQEACKGYCSANGCMSNYVVNASGGCESENNCHKCGFFGLKKCCDYLPTACCELPKPPAEPESDLDPDPKPLAERQTVTSCATGICTYKDCPEGTEDIGQVDCGTKKKCKTGCWGFCKECSNKQTKCCMATVPAKCDQDRCQNSGTCPSGTKSIGVADCGSFEKTKGCGFLNLANCKEPAPRTCCAPQ